MFCILAPEMGLGDPLRAPRKRQLFDDPGGKTKKIRWKLPEKPTGAKHHTLASVFSGLGYSSVKSSVARAATVKVTKKERRVMRAQDIFTHDPNTSIHHTPSAQGREGLLATTPNGSSTIIRGRSATPMSALSLDKALPALPDERSDVDADVCVQDIEGYIDMLAYLRRDLPNKPQSDAQTAAAAATAATSPQATIIRPPVKEDEWISSRSQSRQSTTYTTSEDEIHRMRSRSASGMLSHSASASRKTVTPMSSMGSDGDLRAAISKTRLAPAPATTKIEEVSEPATSSSELTPRRRSTPMPLVCYHCGRDPSGRDVKDVGGSPMTAFEVHESKAAQLVSEHVDGVQMTGLRGDDEGQQVREQSTQAETDQPDDADILPAEDEGTPEVAERTKDHEVGDSKGDDTSERLSPFARPSNPDPYAGMDDHTPTKPGIRPVDEKVEQEIDLDLWPDFESGPPQNHVSAELPSPRAEPSAYDRSSDADPYSYVEDTALEGTLEKREGGVDLEPASFWKNPEGVILVYQGVELDGNGLYFGNDINYLGSFYDDDEGSSGLGSRKNSTADLAGTGTGLAMIPEVGSTEDLWDDEVFGA